MWLTMSCSCSCCSCSCSCFSSSSSSIAFFVIVDAREMHAACVCAVGHNVCMLGTFLFRHTPAPGYVARPFFVWHPFRSMYAYAPTNIHFDACPTLSSHMHTSTRTHMHIYKHTHIHIYTHTHTHTHTHTARSGVPYLLWLAAFRSTHCVHGSLPPSAQRAAAILQQESVPRR